MKKRNRQAPPVGRNVWPYNWRFIRLLLEKTTPILSAHARPGMLNSVFGLKETEDIHDAPSYSHEEKYWLDLFKECSEIVNSIERLEQAHAFFRYKGPVQIYMKYQITEVDWMHYHVEMYLHEMYMLCCRLSTFLIRIERRARKRGNSSGAGLAAARREEVEAAFRSPVKMRSEHVHLLRFRTPDLADLGVLSLLTTTQDPTLDRKTFKQSLKTKRNEVVKKWGRDFRANRRTIRALCDRIFIELKETVIGSTPKHD